jgi:electron transfer flavoprotein alpha subunit
MRHLGLPVVSDVVDFAGGDDVVLTREMYGSKVETAVQTPTPAVVTIRGRTWPPAEADGSATRSIRASTTRPFVERCSASRRR